MEGTNVAALLEKFGATMKDLKGAIDRVEGETKEHGKASEEAKAQLAGMVKSYDEALKEIAETKKRVEEMELRMGRRGIGGGPGGEEKSPGEIFAESSQYKTMLERGGYNSHKVEIGGLEKHRKTMMERKSLTSASTSGGAAIVPYRAPGIVSPPTEMPRIRDLLPSLPLSSGTIEYVRETNFYELYTTLTSDLTGAETVIPVANASGFYPGQTIDIDGTEKVIDTDGVDLDALELTLTATVGVAKTSGDPVTSTTFVYTAETYLKPLSEAELELVSSNVRTLAHWIPASRQVLMDAPALRGYIDQRLMNSAILSSERQILYGAGGTTELDGIMVDTGVQSYSWSSGIVGDTKLDAIRRAMTLAQLAHYPVTGVVVHPDDWEDIELLKGDDLHYLWASVVEGGVQRVWRAPVVVTTAINSGECLVGAFNLGARIWDREQASIRTSDSHEDFFTRNMVAILMEERMTLTVERPASFVAVTFDAAPT